MVASPISQPTATPSFTIGLTRRADCHAADRPAPWARSPGRLHDSARLERMTRLATVATSRSSWVAMTTLVPSTTCSARISTRTSKPDGPGRRSAHRGSAGPAPDESGGQRQPSLLATGQPVRTAVAEDRRRQPDPVHEAIDGRGALAIEPEADLIAHGRSQGTVAPGPGTRTRPARPVRPERAESGSTPEQPDDARSGLSSPTSSRASVDLPLPFGPTSATRSAATRRSGRFPEHRNAAVVPEPEVGGDDDGPNGPRPSDRVSAVEWPIGSSGSQITFCGDARPR